ncbi:MAG: hypothetical protein Q9M29_04670 [Mariprofundaceae bacterium]|nr:hypothetical protein [Mariprofundaceae bacterium]
MLPLADYLVSRIGLTGTIVLVSILCAGFIYMLWRNHRDAETKHD